MSFFHFVFITFFTFLVGFQLRDAVRLFHRWIAPVFPLADSRWRQRLRNWSIDIALSAFLSLIVVASVLASDLFGRLAGRLI